MKRILLTLKAQGRKKPGVRVLRRAIRKRSKDGKVPDSALERFALKVVEGLNVQPILHHKITLPSGRTIKVDFGFPEHKLAIEFDGYDGHCSRWALTTDRARDRGLHLLGWIPLRYVWDDVQNQESTVLAEIRALLVQRRAA